MPDRYKPNGIPLSDYERELLVILMEECAEVIQAASKLIRFGKENRPDSDVSNSIYLSREVGDLWAMINMAEAAQLIDGYDIQQGLDRKRVRVAEYMQTAAGTSNG